MPQQFINTGSKANNKTGDSLRNAFKKINSNFTELYPTVPNLPENLIIATSYVYFNALQTTVGSNYQAFKVGEFSDTITSNDRWSITGVTSEINVWVSPSNGILTKIIYQHQGNTNSSFGIIKNPTFGGLVRDSNWDFETTSTTQGPSTKFLLQPNLSVSMGDFLGFGIESKSISTRLYRTFMYAYMEFT